jgi:hypothetical protein
MIMYSIIISHKNNEYGYHDNHQKAGIVECFLAGEMRNLIDLEYSCPNPEAFEENSLPILPFIKRPA